MRREGVRRAVQRRVCSRRPGESRCAADRVLGHIFAILSVHAGSRATREPSNAHTMDSPKRSQDRPGRRTPSPAEGRYATSAGPNRHRFPARRPSPPATAAATAAQGPTPGWGGHGQRRSGAPASAAASPVSCLIRSADAGATGHRGRLGSSPRRAWSQRSPHVRRLRFASRGTTACSACGRSRSRTTATRLRVGYRGRRTLASSRG